MTVDPRLQAKIKSVARDINRLKREVAVLQRAPQGQYRSFQGQNYVYDTDGVLRQVIGEQPDGTYTTIDVNADAPPPPSAPIVIPAPGMLTITWDGQTWNNSSWPTDWDRVEVHLNSIAGEPATDSNEIASFHSLSGGTISVPLDRVTWYVSLTAVNTSGAQSIKSTEVQAVPGRPADPLSDGLAPATAPLVTVVGGVGAIFARWTAISNHDLVTYRVYMSDSPDAAQNSSTLVYEGPNTAITLKSLSGAATDTYDPSLRYDTPYYVWVQAVDADGSGPMSAPVSAIMYQINSPDIATNAVRANNIAAGSITGELFSGTIVLGSTLSTGSIDQDPTSATFGQVTGQRVQLDASGLRVIDTSGKTIVNLSTDSGLPSEFEGEIRTTSLHVLGGTTIESKNNEIARDSTVTLSVGTSDPVNSPNIARVYDIIRFDTSTRVTATTVTSLTPTLGTFAFDPTNVSAFCWDSTKSVWIVVTYQNSGSRVWHFNPNGTLYTVVSGGVTKPLIYDRPNWKLTGVAVAPGNTSYSYVGQYANQWYVSDAARNNAPNYISLVNNNSSPTISYTGTANQYLVGENSGSLRLTYSVYQSSSTPYSSASLVQRRTLGSMTGPSSTGRQFVNVLRGTFDYGTTRIVAHVYNNSDDFVVTSDLTDAGRSTANQWSVATSGITGFDWDGTNFWSLHNDGILRKYTTAMWADTYDTVHAAMTWYDSKTTGTITAPENNGQHETRLGTKVSTAYYKRSKLRITMPNPANSGGSDDPDSWRLYMCRGYTTTPVDTAFSLIAQGVAAGVVDVLSVPPLSTPVSPHTHPALNNFPLATPGAIVSGATRADGSPKLSLQGDSFGRWDGLIPPGYIAMWGGQAGWSGSHVASGDPIGWLICDGRSLSTVLYSELFAVIGYAYDTTLSGQTTFRIPDMRGRFPLGYNPSAALYGDFIGDSDQDSLLTDRESRMNHSHIHGINPQDETAYPEYTAASGTTRDNLARHGRFDGHSHGGETQGASALMRGNVHAYLTINYMIKI